MILSHAGDVLFSRQRHSLKRLLPLFEISSVEIISRMTLEERDWGAGASALRHPVEEKLWGRCGLD